MKTSEAGQPIMLGRLEVGLAQRGLDTNMSELSTLSPPLKWAPKTVGVTDKARNRD